MSSLDASGKLTQLAGVDVCYFLCSPSPLSFFSVRCSTVNQLDLHAVSVVSISIFSIAIVTISPAPIVGIISLAPRVITTTSLLFATARLIVSRVTGSMKLVILIARSTRPFDFVVPPPPHSASDHDGLWRSRRCSRYVLDLLSLLSPLAQICSV